MKLVQKLLLAPAALGLMAPVAASASDLASAGGMNSYIQQGDLHNFRVWADQNQVTNVQQFSDVKPTDWAYQALSNLIERYGCVAGYPNGTFKGAQAMTRFEAAALLNACLDRITETTDEIQRLQQDFAKELAVLQGRVGSLEKKVGKLEATQFSTTTKLQGDTYWAIGGAGFGGNTPASQYNANTYGAMVFNYDLRLNFITSFTGKDTLYTRLRSGNFSGSPFAGNPYNLMNLDRSFSGSSNQGTTANNNDIYLDRLYYRFPVRKGSAFTALVGPMARNTEALGISPFYYGAFEGLDFFRLHGAPAVYNKATGGTVALVWKQPVKKGKPFFTASTSYVAPNANSGNTNSGSGQGGIGGNYSNGTFLTQIGYQAQQWKASFGWNYSQCGTRSRSGSQAGIGTEPCTANQWTGGSRINTNWNVGAYSNAFALGLAWEPKKSGTYVPSVSLGWGYSALAYTNNSIWGSTTTQTGNSASANAASTIAGNLVPGNIAATQSWTVGLQWKDAFTKGNNAGMAVGQPSFVTSTRNGTTPFDGNYAWEWWYQFKVSDNISVTPMLFYLSNPSSLGAGGAQPSGQVNPNVFGGLLTASFKF
jgi:hypothetical protein